MIRIFSTSEKTSYKRIYDQERKKVLKETEVWLKEILASSWGT